MVCHDCGVENPEGANFCSNCGLALWGDCPSCKAPVPKDASYCGQCGATLTAAAHAGAGSVGVGEPAIVGATLRCPRCHTVNESGSAYCESCGLPLDDTPAATSPTGGAQRTGRQTGLQLQDKGPNDWGRPAGFWIRFAAYIIDGFLLTLVTAILAALLFGENYFETLANFDFVGDPTAGEWLVDILQILYSTAMVAVFAGTVGKLVLRTRVVQANGEPVGHGRAFARAAAQFVLGALIFPIFISAFMIGLRRDKRGIHDLVCGTAVIMARS